MKRMHASKCSVTLKNIYNYSEPCKGSDFSGDVHSGITFEKYNAIK